MSNAKPPMWQRWRTWLAVRLGLWRGRWVWVDMDAAVARWTWWAMPWHARTWRMGVYHPPGLREDEAAPLILLLHGCRQQALPFAEASGWVRAADRERLRLLCPQQRDAANPLGCWNWFLPAAQAGRGELDVVIRGLAQVQARWPCREVAVVGLSAGGALAALLAFHHAEHVDAVVVVAAPPLLGRANAQDPRTVMREGIGASLALSTLGLRDCAPMLVVQGTDDEVVAPVCAQQLVDQAREVLRRAGVALREEPRADGLALLEPTQTLRLQHLQVPGLGHAWTGGPGGHAYTPRGGPDLTAQALAFLRQVRVLPA